MKATSGANYDGQGLFFNSEQVVEAAHQKFGIFWEKYKTLNLESDAHGTRLLQCVIDFNASNL